MNSPTPRLKSITGVARALIATVGTDEALSILIAQFGWDVAFSAIANIDSAEAQQALFMAVERLLEECDR